MSSPEWILKRRAPASLRMTGKSFLDFDDGAALPHAKEAVAA